MTKLKYIFHFFSARFWPAGHEKRPAARDLQNPRTGRTLVYNLTDDLTDKRLDRQREYQSNYIDSQNEEQIVDRLDKHKEYLTSLREQETAEIHTSHLQDKVKLYTKSLNSKLALNFARSQIASEVSDTLVAEYSFGSMRYSCSYCVAKLWES